MDNKTIVNWHLLETEKWKELFVYSAPKIHALQQRFDKQELSQIFGDVR